MKERVSLSKRPLKDGTQSLFLDYYIDGHRRRDNLKLYIRPEKTPLDRARNSETMRIASAARDKKAFEIEQMEAGIKVASRPVAVRFSDYSEIFIRRYSRQRTIVATRSTINHVAAFRKGVLLQEMDGGFFQGFIKYLVGLGDNPNSVSKHVTRVLTILKQAKYDMIISEVPHVTQFLPQRQTPIREFLTIDELRMMDSTFCKNPMVKMAFLFACFTGLRYIDICNLKPENISGDELVIRQRKTSEPVRIPLSANARKFLPEGWETSSFLFRIPCNLYTNDFIKEWGRKAGITKNLHFHIARHTFATLMLANGVDIYTVSKLLGHTSIGTTQIYAKVIDEVKRKAVSAIPTL